jgi:hypothetical protein
MDDNAQQETPIAEADTAEALRIAGRLIDAGIPVFAAPPCPSGPFGEIDENGTVARCQRDGHGIGAVEYDLPAKWQLTIPSRVWLERWRPGWALAAVGGHAADFLDIDPRNGGEDSFAEMIRAGQWPTVFGTQRTPSGGQHDLISPVGERKVTGLLPGIDYQGGAADGAGRGFVWIAPTIRRSKTDGQMHAYQWTQEPDLDWLSEFDRDLKTGSFDPSLDGLRLRLAGHRAKRDTRMTSARVERGSAARVFTPAAMEHFLQFTETPLRSARVGEIEERANAYACALSHFVPDMLTAEQAHDRLLAALGETAYDPGHPASRWTADKFVAVIADVGGRAPADWHAVAGQDGAEGVGSAGGGIETAVAATPVDGDAVSALLGEMVTADDLASREPPRYMIEGLLQFDSESWVIGEPGSRKSFVVLDMAGHVAAGRPWQGRRVNQALVVFIIAEGAGGSALRIQAWQKRYGAMGNGIRFLPRPVQAGKPEAWAVLVQACARLSHVAAEAGQGLLVVLDTQARVTVGLKENDATDMGVFIDAVRAIREASGACVLTVHHTGRKGGDARGSSAIDGAQTTELKVVKDASPGGLGGLYGRVITEKQKDITEAEDVLLKFDVVDLGTDADGRPLDSLVLAPDGSWRQGEVDVVGRPGRDGMQEKISEPGEWTRRLCPSEQEELKRRILQTVAEVGGEYGCTEAKAKAAVISTWYPRGEGRGQGRLETGRKDAGWALAWARVTELRVESAGDFVPVLTPVAGAKFRIDSLLTDG